MGLFQASMLHVMKSLRDEMLALKNKESDADKSSKLKPCLDFQNPTLLGLLIRFTWIHRKFSQWAWSLMALNFHLGLHKSLTDSAHYQARPKHKNHSDKRKHKSKPSTNLSCLQRKMSPLPIPEG